MPSNLLHVPFWLCDQLLLDKILARIIDKDFYQPSSAFEDLARAQRLHSYIVSGAKEANTDLAKYENALAEFYYFVKDLESKFPDNVVTFEWYDTCYHKPSLVQARSWRLERHYIVFQTGLLYSQKAHLEEFHTDEGIKKACGYFQTAAGCFQFLLDLDVEEVGIDLNTIRSLRAIMESKAQELIWQKAARSMPMKDLVIARLSMKVAELYGEAVMYSDRSDLIRQEWVNLLRVKHFHFIAAAHYRMSINALDTFEYGVQVAYLKSALQLCKGAMKHKMYVNEFVMEDLSGLTTTVEECLRTAQRDNDLVYYKLVPEAAELPAIIGVSMVEPKIPLFLTERDASFEPAFTKLMPFAVVQVSQAFRERQEQYIATSFHEPLSALTRMLRQFLSERQLPASLDTWQIPDDIPASIVSHAQEIMSVGGIRIIESSMDEISILAANSRALVNECEERLRLEKQEDDLMGEREGLDSWTRTPSDVSSAQHWTKVEKMQDYLSQGQASDAVLGEIYVSLKATLEIYCGGEKALLKCIPKNGHFQLDPAGEKVAFELRDLLSEVSKLETNRERFEISIDLKSRNHGILPVVIDLYKRNPERFQNRDGSVDQMKFDPIYEKHVSFFNSDLAYVAKLKEQQINLEKRIGEVNQIFDSFKAKSLNKTQEARFNVLQTLENDYVRYLELIQNLNLASKFYAAFSERANVVLEDFDDYLKTRREEARELAIAIHDQRNFEGIEQSKTRNLGNLTSLASKLQTKGLWDPSEGIKFT